MRSLSSRRFVILTVLHFSPFRIITMYIEGAGS